MNVWILMHPTIATLLYIWRACMQLLYGYGYKGMLSKSIPLAACAWCNMVVAYIIAMCKNYLIKNAPGVKKGVAKN